MRKIYLNGSLWVELDEFKEIVEIMMQQQKQYAEDLRAIKLKLEAEEEDEEMEEENRKLIQKPYKIPTAYTDLRSWYEISHNLPLGSSGC
ncbi:MAG: hypothetical protein MN733_35720 [Nitrososphaera sp.]|nr:hypothetical protein [Nitrososphaera sp.]